MAPQSFTYYGVNVRPVRPNASGFRYEAHIEGAPWLYADTKDGMKELIRQYLPSWRKRR